MSPDVPSLEDLVHAICEGTPVEWDALEQIGNDTFRSQVAALRLVAGIAQVHRVQPIDTADPAPAQPDVPRRWGHLDVLEHISNGAFGDVYRAWDPQLDREVALKLLRRAPDAEAHADEVVEEGRLLARLRHPHIVSVYGAARIDGQVGLWMEYLRGRTLAQAVGKEGALPARKVAEIGARLCDALAAVHKAGLVHRDVKAQNVMLADDGRVVLMDFGAGGDLRHVGLNMAGTPLYLAPEVARGAPASPQSDIYSLGVLLRYAATGGHSRDVVPSLNDKARKRLLAVVTTASARDPRDRYTSAEASGRALRDLLVPSRLSSTLVVAGTCLVVGLGALVVALLRTGSAQDTADRAFEMAWQTASPRRAPLSAQQVHSLGFDYMSELSQSGTLAAGTEDGSQVGLVSTNPGSDDVREWVSHSREAGHVESAIPSTDGLQVAYVWIDTACRCASIRVANRQGTERMLFTRAELRGAWLGEWRNSVLPALLAPEQGPHELALIDVPAGTVRVVRKVERDPQGFSLSPDRRFFAFDAPQHRGPGALREIVVFEVHTGRSQRVASAGRNWVMPRWSPDGARLFFLERERENTALLAVRIEHGRAIRQPVKLRDSIGSVGSFGFTSGTALGYWTGPRRNFFTVQAAADGTFSASRAVRATDSHGTMPAWSPDGRSLAWTDFGEPTGTIRIQGPEGRPQAVSAVLGSAIFPTWSPDGRRLAFWTTDLLTRSVQIVDLASGRITEHLRRGYPYFGGEFGLSWTGDGKKLLISPTSDQIMSLDAETGTLRTFYKPHGASIETYFYLSPDGHSLALVEARGKQRQLRVIPLDSKGTAAQLEAPDRGLLIGWHADGRSVLAMRSVFPTSDDSPLGESELWRFPIDGTPKRSLGLKAPGMIYAAISPDAKRVAYESGTWATELWLLSPADTQ